MPCFIHNLMNTTNSRKRRGGVLTPTTSPLSDINTSSYYYYYYFYYFFWGMVYSTVSDCYGRVERPLPLLRHCVSPIRDHILSAIQVPNSLHSAPHFLVLDLRLLCILLYILLFYLLSLLRKYILIIEGRYGIYSPQLPVHRRERITVFNF